MPEYQQKFLDEKKLSTIFLDVTNLSCSWYPLHISVVLDYCCMHQAYSRNKPLAQLQLPSQMHKFNLNDWRINVVILISEDQILLQRKLGRPSPPKYTTSAAACKRLLVSLFWRESSNSYYSSATEEKTCCRLRKKSQFTI